MMARNTELNKSILTPWFYQTHNPNTNIVWINRGEMFSTIQQTVNSGGSDANMAEKTAALLSRRTIVEVGLVLGGGHLDLWHAPWCWQDSYDVKLA